MGHRDEVGAVGQTGVTGARAQGPPAATAAARPSGRLVPPLVVMALAMSLLVAAGTSPAAAQHLFPNPDLDDGLAPWTSYISPVGELAADVDVDGCAGSISARGDSEEFEGVGGKIEVAGIVGCFDRPPGLDHLYLDLSYRLDAASADVLLNVIERAVPGCALVEGILTQAPVFPASASWTHARFDLPVQVGTQSIVVQLLSFTPENNPHSLFVDRLYAGSADPIHLDGFESGDDPPCRWN